MGTKADPGEFDCYKQAYADEPIFTLRARDPLAPLVVRFWRMLRFFQRPPWLDVGEQDKQAAAMNCADAMENYRLSRFKYVDVKPRKRIIDRIGNAVDALEAIAMASVEKP